MTVSPSNTFRTVPVSLSAAAAAKERRRRYLRSGSQLRKRLDGGGQTDARRQTEKLIEGRAGRGAFDNS
jgi:hypothetical protein